MFVERGKYNMRIKEEFNNSIEVIEKGMFSKWINEEWLRKKNEDNNGRITRDELEKRMGIGKNTLKKVINKNRPTSSRDYIIAICSQLGMNSEETNEALFLYNMPPLCESAQNEKRQKYFLRDKLLISLLDQEDMGKKNRKNIVHSIDEINNELKARNLAELDIPDRKISSRISLDYYIRAEKTKLNIEGSFFDQYQSLEMQYSADMYECSTLMLIEIKETKEQLVLAYNNGRRDIYKYDKGIDCFSNKKYNTPENFKNYAKCFAQLRSKNKAELMRINLQLDDTKNYRERISAKYNDGKISVFMESFNYYVPELNEYYFIEYCDGKMKYSISNKSQFMFSKIGEKEYLKIYKEYDSMETAKGNSIEDLIETYDNKLIQSSVSDYIAKRIRKEITKMESEIKIFIKKLKNKEVFIRNIAYIFEEPDVKYNIAKYFKVDDKFEFKKERCIDLEVYIPIKNEFHYKDIIINFSDLYNAFELGLETVDDIYKVKSLYGSIEALRENL